MPTTPAFVRCGAAAGRCTIRISRERLAEALSAPDLDAEA
jgi:hypothetical protein